MFESGGFPTLIVKPGEIETLVHCERWLCENITELGAQLAKNGALLFRGFPVDSAETFDRFSAVFGYPNFTYKESLSNAVRVNFSERVFTANEAPKDVEIYLHHEMAQTPISPSKLFFYCQSAAEQGGATPICRSDQLYQAIKSWNPALASEFEQKGLKYKNRMPAEDNPESGQGRSWRSTLSVDNKEQAETRLQKLGYSWRWMSDDSLEAETPVLPAVRKLPGAAEVFYNQLVAAYMGWQGVREDPSIAVTFGDGSRISADDLDEIVRLSKAYTYDLCWQDGDIALLDNNLCMHGRRPYSGQRRRQVLVVLAA